MNKMSNIQNVSEELKQNREKCYIKNQVHLQNTAFDLDIALKQMPNVFTDSAVLAHFLAEKFGFNHALERAKMQVKTKELEAELERIREIIFQFSQCYDDHNNTADINACMDCDLSTPFYDRKAAAEIQAQVNIAAKAAAQETIAQAKAPAKQNKKKYGIEVTNPGTANLRFLFIY